MNRANLLLIMAWTAIAAQAAPAGNALQIRFCDEVGLPAAELAKFRDEVSGVMSKAGVESAWVYCSISNPAENPAGCREPLKPTEVVVRLRAKASKDRDQSLGVSIALKDGSGVHTSLHFEQIAGLAERAKVDSTHLVALIALHEVGHLLMGPDHFPLGIMQPNWGCRQVDETLRRDLFFTEPQARKLQASLNARAARLVASAK